MMGLSLDATKDLRLHFCIWILHSNANQVTYLYFIA